MATIWLNSKREIVKADNQWDELANKNNAAFLAEKIIKGTPFLHFVKGDAIRMFLDSIISRVLITGKTYILHYRCDSGTTAQFMRMLVKRLGDDEISIEHELINGEKISPSILFTENESAKEKRCAICGKVEFKNHWHDALTNRKIFGTIYELETKSVICPDCEKEYVEPIKETTG